MKNFVKELANKSVEEAFTSFAHYQPKIPNSLMEKVQKENKED